MSYISGNKKVVTVSSTGKVTIKGCGKTIITIIAEESSAYKSAETEVTVNITPKKVKIQKFSALGNCTLKVAWSSESGVSGYEIGYDAVKENIGKYEKRTTCVGKKQLSKTFKLNSKSKNKTCYVSVRAYVKSGSTMIYGPWATAKKVVVK